MDSRQRNGHSVIAASLLLLIIGGAVTEGLVEQFTEAHLTYFLTGMMSAMLCLCVLAASSRLVLAVGAGSLVLLGVLPRLMYRLAGPGLIHLSTLMFVETVVLQAALLCVILITRSVVLRRPVKARWLAEGCVLAFAFAVPAVAVPVVLGEALRSHQLGSVDLALHDKVISSPSGANLFLYGPSLNQMAPPQEAALIANDERLRIVCELELEGKLLGARLNEREAMLVVRGRKSGEFVKLRLMRYTEKGIASECVYSCPASLAPSEWTNALSPDGTFVALNDAKFIEFQSAKACPDKEGDGTVSGPFVEWTRDSKSAVYYVPKTKEILVVNPSSGLSRRHSLVRGTNDPLSITLSPRTERVAYTADAGREVLFQDLDTAKAQRVIVPRLLRLRLDSRLVWIDESTIVYVCQTHSVCRIDAKTGRITLLSQILEVVNGLSYSNGSGQVIWTSHLDTGLGVSAWRK